MTWTLFTIHLAIIFATFVGVLALGTLAIYFRELH